jgi:hypothetical protein
VIPLRALERQPGAEQIARPHACREHHRAGADRAGGGLERVHAPVGARQPQHLDARPDIGAGKQRGDVALGVAVRFLRVVHGAGDRRRQRRLELPGFTGGELRAAGAREAPR